MRCVCIPTELPFCTPPLVVGTWRWPKFVRKKNRKLSFRDTKRGGWEKKVVSTTTADLIQLSICVLLSILTTSFSLLCSQALSTQWNQFLSRTDWFSLFLCWTDNFPKARIDCTTYYSSKSLLSSCHTPTPHTHTHWHHHSQSVLLLLLREFGGWKWVRRRKLQRITRIDKFMVQK